MKRKTVCIAIIEDNPGDLRLLLEMFKEPGMYRCEVLSASTLQEGMELLERGGPDIIMLDLNLSDSMGIETLHKIVPFNIPVVVLSGLDDFELANTSIQHGAQDYLVKGSFTSNILFRTINYCLERDQIKKELLKNKNNLKMLIEKSADGIVIVDSHGLVLFSNSIAAKRFGINVNHNVHNVFGIIDTEQTKEIEISLNDKIFILELISSSIIWDNLEVFLVTLRDVTRHVKLQKSLQETKDEIIQQRNMVRNYLDIAGVMILILDINGNVVLINKKGCEILGYAEDGIVGKNWFDNFIPDALKNEIRSIHSNLISQENKVLEYYENAVISSGNELKYIAWHNSILSENGTITGLLCSGEDITDRRKTEFREHLVREILVLLNSTDTTEKIVKKILRIIKENTGIESIAIRLKDGDDYPYYETNGFQKSFVEKERYLCSYNSDGEIERGPDGRAAHECMCGRILNGNVNATSSVFTAEGSFWTNSTSELVAEKDNIPVVQNFRNGCNRAGYESVALIPLKSKGTIIGLLQLNDHRKNVFSAADISFFESLGSSIGIALLRKLVEDELKFKNIILSTQQEASIDGILSVDEHGEIISFNNRFKELWGLADDVIESHSDTIAIEAVLNQIKDPKSFVEKLEYLSENYTETSFDEISLFDGRTFDRYSAPMIDPDSRYYGRIWYFRDISDKKETERMLIASEKMSEIAKLSAGVAHEFNNILAIIKSSAQLLLMENNSGRVELSEYICDELESIDRQTKRGSDIVSNLMLLSKPDEVEIDKIYIEDVIEDVLKLQKQQFNIENITVITDFGRQALINVNPGQMQQIFLNLTINARHALYPKKGGEIRISTAYTSEYVAIQFEDTGIGIKKANIKNIFSPFFTTKGAHADDNLGLKGTGLGLSVTNSIIQEYNGFIEVESSEGKGTRFEIRMPLVAPANNKQPANKTVRTGGNKHQDAHILIVDDEKEIANNIARMLSLHGYAEVETITKPEQLEDRIFESTYDVFFIDMQMPVLNGTDLFHQIKQNKLNGDSRIVLMSGLYNDKTKDILESCSGCFFMKKPFDSKKILETLEIVFEK